MHYLLKGVFICTPVQIILWLYVPAHCRAAFTQALILSSIICLHFAAYCTVPCWMLLIKLVLNINKLAPKIDKLAPIECSPQKLINSPQLNIRPKNR